MNKVIVKVLFLLFSIYKVGCKGVKLHGHVSMMFSCFSDLCLLSSFYVIYVEVTKCYPYNLIQTSKAVNELYMR